MGLNFNKIYYFPFTNGRPVFGLSTTCFPAGRSQPLSDLSSFEK